MGQKEWGPRHKPGLNQLKKGPEAARVTLPLRDFRKNAELSMCGLTTEWILESAQSLACALTITWILEERSMPWSGELLIPRSERELRHTEGSGKLIGNPLVEGSSASSTDGELWRAENSFLRMRGTQLPMRSSRAENSLLRVRGNSDAPKGAACS